MSEATTTVDTQNQMFTNYDTAKVFVFNPRTEIASYTNDGYDDETLKAGTLMGRVASTNEIVKLESGASDGSQFPVGIVVGNTTVEAGETVDVTIGVAGDVDKNQIIF